MIIFTAMGFVIVGLLVIGLALALDRLVFARRMLTRFAARWRSLWVAALLLGVLWWVVFRLIATHSENAGMQLMQLGTITLIGWGMALLLHWPNLAALRRADRTNRPEDIFG